jgi:hypothetical protein
MRNEWRVVGVVGCEPGSKLRDVEARESPGELGKRNMPRPGLNAERRPPQSSPLARAPPRTPPQHSQYSQLTPINMSDEEVETKPFKFVTGKLPAQAGQFDFASC